MPETKKDHYAILVTINKYPGLTDLDGPEADGEALISWLTNPAEGNLPPENITHIRSSSFLPVVDIYDSKPTEVQLKQALEKLLREGEGKQRKWKGKAGERLYLYFAGHGFTAGTSLTDPALFSAVAQSIDTAHIACCRYAAKLANAGFFDEILLFIDCCQDVWKSSLVIEPSWICPDLNRSSEVKLLQAIGAPRGKKAFERDLDGSGKTRGIFTVVLLEALRTAIPDAEGWVTGYDFKKQFSQIWAARFREETHYDPPVRLPDGDDIRIFKRSPAPLSPFAEAQSLEVPTIEIDSLDVLKNFHGRTLHRNSIGIDHSVTINKENSQKLPTGIYRIETEGDQNDLVFEVIPTSESLQARNIEFQEIPADFAVTNTGRSYPITIRSEDKAMRIKIVDADYNVVAKSYGELTKELAPGVYKAEITNGIGRTQKMFRVVDQPMTISPPSPSLEQFWLDRKLGIYNPTHKSLGANSQLTVFIRVISDADGGTDSSTPWKNFYVRNIDAKKESISVGFETNDCYGVASLDVFAGCYVLTSDLKNSGEEFGFVVHTFSGWRTEVYIDCRVNEPDNSVAYPDFAQVGIHLVKMGGSESRNLATHLELIRIQFANGHRLDLPSNKDIAKSPMLGLFVAYSIYQRAREDKDAMRKCIHAIPNEIRSLPDIRLLESWLYPENPIPPLSSMDIPQLSIAWELSRNLRPEHQLSPALRGLIGQWRIGGALWTSWKRPLIEFSNNNTGVNYKALLIDEYRLKKSDMQASPLNPTWNMEAWRAQQERLRARIPDRPFQQALRRLLLDAFTLNEEVTEI